MYIRQRIFISLLFLFPLHISACSENNNPPPDIQIGKPAPPFNLIDLKGRPFSLSKEKGKVVIVRFWTTQCKLCKEELPKLENAFQKFRPSGMTLLALNIADSPDTINSFIKGLGLTFPILLDGNKKIAREYQVFGVPTSFLIDKDGILRERYFGDLKEDEMEELIRKYL